MTVGDYGVQSVAEIVSRGKNDYFSHKGVYTNPYKMGTPGFNDYERGWMQSLKHDDGKLAAKAQAQTWMPPQFSSTPVPKTPVNLYAELKGRSGPRK